MTDPVQPLLPPEPWYKSEVQWRAVVAIVAQVVSLGLRTVPMVAKLFGYTIEWTVSEQDIDLLFANLTQGLAFFFAMLSIMKRSKSKIQPLTLTQAGANALREKAPPMLDVDPTKNVAPVSPAWSNNPPPAPPPPST